MDKTNTITLTIDGTDVSVPEGTTILEAAKKVGIEIPHFCYHPKLSIAGNCRVCAVEVEGFPNPVISCREKVTDGMIVNTKSELATSARRDALEFILINHPLDCPICDRAGECKLQDYYFEHSLQPSRFTEAKIKKTKAADAGPYVVLDAERCISCTSCIRFCEEIAGVHEIGLMGRGGRQEIAGEILNKYSLCTVDICPVGALLSKEFRFKKRAWFLESGASICTGCATGCNTWVDHEGGTVYRVRPRQNDEVNGPWMCDDGRMMYKRLASEDRIFHPSRLDNGEHQTLSWNDALHACADLLQDSPKDKIAGILSAKATLEEIAAFTALFKGVIGTENIFICKEDLDPAFEDNILRDKDRNPNTMGCELFTKTELPAHGNFKAFVILGDLGKSDVEKIISANSRATILISTHSTDAKWPNLVLPLAATEEQDGTFINKNSLMQRFNRVYAPPGNAKPGWQIAEDISAILGRPLNIKTARDAYALVQKYVAELKNISYDDVGESNFKLKI